MAEIDVSELSVLNRHGRCSECGHYTLLHLASTTRRGIEEMACLVLSCNCFGMDPASRARSLKARDFQADTSLPKMRYTEA